ncbi:hypothetical protein SKAU_G00340860 [Synaphobranchus kaupii]|uniref:Uncharacterized protein n=1 Tax=Synaphobranchus kaupii TaxID=118154 RepID=A0A9Q1EMX8_SYNKA|nr:hypothetical protein SKAU_G00340860 [Synaphobranchus kaupii]
MIEKVLEELERESDMEVQLENSDWDSCDSGEEEFFLEGIDLVLDFLLPPFLPTCTRLSCIQSVTQPSCLLPSSCLFPFPPSILPSCHSPPFNPIS